MDIHVDADRDSAVVAMLRCGNHGHSQGQENERFAELHGDFNDLPNFRGDRNLGLRSPMRG